MGVISFLQRWFELGGENDDSEYQEKLEHETAKVRAYRAADELSIAARSLMEKALELRSEIEGMADE